jgi:transposase
MEPSMTEYMRVAVDTSKHVFTLHGVDREGRAVLRRNVRRAAFTEFFAKLPATLVVLEACGASHHWGRELQALGHEVMMIPPQYVKPFVKRGKNDRNDAEAICTAAGQPGMARVPVKPAETQAAAVLLSVRELLTRQRTQLVNALRGHAAEFGLVAAKGDAGVQDVLSKAAEPGSLPAPAAEALAMLGSEIDRLEHALQQADKKLMAQHKAPDSVGAMSRLLAGIPGVGWLTALTFSLRIDATQFESGRHLAAWLGLVPREHSTGGKQRLGGISRAGDERLRSLLVLGATAVIRHAKEGKSSPWLLSLLARKPRKLAAVALANKIARVVWAMMTSGENYRQPQAA